MNFDNSIPPRAGRSRLDRLQWWSSPHEKPIAGVAAVSVLSSDPWLDDRVLLTRRPLARRPVMHQRWEHPPVPVLGGAR